MRKSLWLVIVFVLVVAAGLYVYLKPAGTKDEKLASYGIDGHALTLGNTLRYFGNEVRTDLDGDGRKDVVFLVTNQPGGSGTFYYVVAALNTSRGYVGSAGYLLGDRIAPQTTELNPDSTVVVNFADRKPDEPFTAQPSVGKSVKLRFDATAMQFHAVQ